MSGLILEDVESILIHTRKMNKAPIKEAIWKYGFTNIKIGSQA